MNIFDISDIDFSEDKEITEILALSENIRIERIVSSGQITDKDYWYDQSENEFVMVLQGEARILFDNGKEEHLSKGDYLEIPAHVRHQVSFTSVNPVCIWLTVYLGKAEKTGETGETGKTGEIGEIINS